MTQLKYGVSNEGHYAVAVRGSQLWNAVEVHHEFYHAVDPDEIFEDDWDRVQDLIEQIDGVSA